MPILGGSTRGAADGRITLLIGLVLIALALFIWRELPDLPTTPPNSPEHQVKPLISTTIITPHETSGITFTVNEPRPYYVTINRYSGSHVVINKLDGPVVYTIRKKNFEGDRHFEKGTYVVSLITDGGKIAKAFVEVK